MPVNISLRICAGAIALGLAIIASALLLTAQEWPALSFTSIGRFRLPVHVTHAGDGSGRLFVVEQQGRVLIVKNGVVLGTPFLDIASRLGPGGDLHALAFPPDYASKGYFYVKYFDRSCRNTVARYQLTADPDVADATSEQIVLSFTLCGHAGGMLSFGPGDGYLYISTGDGSGNADPANNAQNPASLFGKLLRIDVETGSPATYTVPPSNPFVTSTTYLPEIWALGFRNPWRFSFDRLTGDLYTADVGEDAYEEINFQPATSVGGENYGWRLMEGNECFAGSSCDSAGLTLPAAGYDHTLGCSVTGGLVHRGPGDAALQGVYLYGDYCTGDIWGLRRASGEWLGSRLAATTMQVVTFGEDQAGNQYTADHASGGVYRIIAEAPTPVDLVVGIVGPADLVRAGDPVTYTIQATNQGSGPATAVTITTPLPESFSYGSTSCSDGAATRAGKTISCHFASLEAGATATGTIIATPTVAGAYTVAATAAANEPDPDTATNNAETTTTVRGISLASLALSASTVTGGKTSIATVTLTETAPASGAKVTLATSNSAVATTSAQVTIPSGSISKTFSVTTKAVTSSVTVTISADYGVTKSAALTVLPPTLNGLSRSPASVTGPCQSSTGKVTLTGKAPAGGVTINLTGSNPAIASVPASVHVLARGTSASFSISPLDVSAQQTTTVSATAADPDFGSATYARTLTVKANHVTALTIAPTSGTGPYTADATVTLRCSAPAGGANVTLTSSNAALASLTLNGQTINTLAIPQGQTTGTFQVNMQDVDTVKSVTISATWNGVSKSVKAKINP